MTVRMSTSSYPRVHAQLIYLRSWLKSKVEGMGITNYRVRGAWYIVDGLFKKAELVVGVGTKRKKVEIRNHGLAGGDS